VEKQTRFERLLILQKEISRRIWEADVGKVVPVLVEGESRQGGGQLFGRTTWNRIVNFRGESTLVGHIVPVRITAAYRNSQLGEVG
jgi:tRNA-2-methylthio-N6-dimethylallyladenosine synthase